MSKWQQFNERKQRRQQPKKPPAVAVPKQPAAESPAEPIVADEDAGEHR
jgi:hypothetical protein